MKLILDLMTHDEGVEALNELRASKWEQVTYNFSGRLVHAPRLVQLYGERYPYSGLNQDPQPLTPLLRELIKRVEEHGVRPNSILANLYRDGKDSLSWHKDDELCLGVNPQVAFLSLGKARTMLYKEQGETKKITLPHGSLLIFNGWTPHAIPKEQTIHPRVNLTMRRIIRGPMTSS